MSTRKPSKSELRTAIRARLLYLVEKADLELWRRAGGVDIERKRDNEVVERLTISIGVGPAIRLAYYKNDERQNDICLIPLADRNTGRSDYWCKDYNDLSDILDMLQRYMILDELSDL